MCIRDRANYLGAMKNCSAVIGNSSSGIIEAPAVPIPTVNIGDRQAGRLRAESVIDCGTSTADISEAINLALTPAFRNGLASMIPPYGRGGATARIFPVLKSANPDTLLIKRFRDFPVPEGA